MADVDDINPFEEHETRTDETTGDNIPLTPIGGSTWEPEREQKTSLKGERTIIAQDRIKDLFRKLSGRIVVTPETFHSVFLKIEDGELYYIGSSKPLTKAGVLLPALTIADRLGKNRLRELGFNVPKGKITAWEFIMINIAGKIYLLRWT